MDDEAKVKLERARMSQPVQAKAKLASENPNAKGRLITPPSSGNAPKLVLRKPATATTNYLKKKPSNVGKLRVNKLTTEKDSGDFEEKPEPEPQIKTETPKEEIEEVVTEVITPPSPVAAREPPKYKNSMEEKMAKLQAMNGDFFANA